MKINRIVTILICLFFYQSANNAQTTYTAVINGNWDDTGTWSPAGIPGPGDFIILLKQVLQEL